MKTILTFLSILAFGIHGFAAEATMDVKDKAGNVQWTLKLTTEGPGKDAITVRAPGGNRAIVLLRLGVQSGRERAAAITGLSRIEEMARNAQSQRLTVPMEKYAEPTINGWFNSFAFRINQKGEHEMIVNGNPYTPDQVKSLKELVNRLDSYAAELRKATKI